MPLPWKCQIRPFFGIALDHALDDLVGGLVLLVAADDLDAAVLLVGGEEGEVLQDVQHHLGPEHALDRGLDVVQLRLPRWFSVVAPRAPHLDGHADGAVAEQLALGGKGEDVRHEHGRHLLLVDLVDLEGAVEPGHGAARGRLGLADDQRQAVDQEDHVEALLHRAGLVGPLVGDDELVVGRAAASTRRTGTCSPCGPKGMVFSPRSQAMKFSLARTRPSACTESRMARRS